MNHSFEETKDRVVELLTHSPFVKSLQLEIVEFTEGHCIGRIPLREETLNPYKTMHGGVLYALADTVCGTVANSYGEVVITVNGNFNYLRATGDTQYVYCDARIVRCGGHLVVVHGDIKDDAGKLLDEGTFNFYRTGVDILSEEAMKH